MPATRYTGALADEIIARLSEGETLRGICREKRMPCYRAVADWRRKYPEFDQRYQQAMLDGCHALLDETKEIADNTDEDPASRKVRVWTRLELVKRKRPDVFGDKVTHQHGGSVSVSLADVLAKLSPSDD